MNREKKRNGIQKTPLQKTGKSILFRHYGQMKSYPV